MVAIEKFAGLLLLLLTPASVGGQLASVNLALNKPSKLSSTFVFSMNSFDAHFGNDGDKSDCRIFAGSAPWYVASADHGVQDPWYSIDLESPTVVAGIKITTTSDYPTSLNNFIIGVTDDDPDTVKLDPDTGNYDLCAQWQGAVSAGTHTLLCKGPMPARQYIFLMIDAVSKDPAICELEVYGPAPTAAPPAAAPPAAKQKKKKNPRCQKALYRRRHRKACGWVTVGKKKSRYQRRRQFQKKQRQRRRQQRRQRRRG